jgi:predicted nucleic acid-binding protein
MNLVVDACVFVAEQIEDQREFAAADEFFDHCVRNGIRLYAPAIVLAEVTRAVARIRYTGNEATALEMKRCHTNAKTICAEARSALRL